VAKRAATAELKGEYRLTADLTLRAATLDDLDAIMVVERKSFEFPWPLSVFRRELKNDWSRIEVACDAGGRVWAFIVYWIVHDELHLLNIAVDPELRRQGVGRRLMKRLEDICAENDLTYLTLEVRVSNEHAITLYQSEGYSIIRRRKAYYVENREDAYVMAKVLAEPAA
jgi:ribosomal-protein-alanine N-acetyltransferase